MDEIRREAFAFQGFCSRNHKFLVGSGKVTLFSPPVVETGEVLGNQLVVAKSEFVLSVKPK